MMTRGAHRALLNGALWTLADTEPAHIHTDDERLARLTDLVAQTNAAAHDRASDIDSHVMRIAAAALAWLDNDLCERAAEEAA